MIGKPMNFTTTHNHFLTTALLFLTVSCTPTSLTLHQRNAVPSISETAKIYLDTVIAWNTNYGIANSISLTGSSWPLAIAVGSDHSPVINLWPAPNMFAPGVGQVASFVKMSPTGSIVWAKQLIPATFPTMIDPSPNSWPETAQIDSDDSIYFAGFTSSNMFETNGGSNDMWIVKLDKNGNTLWAKQIGADTIAAYNVANGTSFSAAGLERAGDATIVGASLYLAGTTSGSLGATNPDGGSDVFMIKIDRATGALQKIWQAGQPGNQYAGHPTYINNKFILGGSTDTSLNDTLSGTSDILFYQVSADLSAATHHQLGQNFATANGLNLSGGESAGSMMIDPHGNMVLPFTCVFDFIEVHQGNDICVISMSNVSTVNWVKHFGTTSLPTGTANESLKSASIDSKGTLFLTLQTTSSLFDNFAGGIDYALIKVNSSDGTLISGKQYGQNAGSPFASGSLTGNEWNYASVYRDGKVYSILSSESTNVVGPNPGTETPLFIIHDAD
jgi:hypothetical protein